MPEVAEAKRFFNYPFAAIEEALSNAIYHKGYDVREPIEVRILPDRIEIVSHPGADRSITQEGLKQYRVFNRRYRNRRIGEFLKEMHLTEGRNTGFKKILNALEKNGSPKPLFETDDERTSFAVTIFIHPNFAIGKDFGKDFGKNFGKDKFELSEEEQSVYLLIVSNNSINIPTLSKETQISQRTISRILDSLKDKGFIMRVGTKNGSWKVLK